MKRAFSIEQNHEPISESNESISESQSIKSTVKSSTSSKEVINTNQSSPKRVQSLRKGITLKKTNPVMLKPVKKTNDLSLVL